MEGGIQRPITKPKKDWRRCAYCDARRTTVDHVPPRGIFGDLESPNVNLLTVPACADCNNPETKDDVYFRDAVYVLAVAKETAVPLTVRAAVARSLRHASHEYVTPIGEFLRSAVPAWGVFNDSPLIQQGKAIAIAWHRVRRTAGRIVRGLYWYHKGVRVPEDLEVSIIGDKERELFQLEQFNAFSELADASLRGERKTIVPGIFSYSIAPVEGDDRYAIFLLAFYESSIFLGIVALPCKPSVLVIP